MGNLATPKSVQKLQMALHAKAKAEPSFRFYALYDKISREDVLAHAYAQCRSNKGAAGVDGQDFADIEAYGVERWLGELALALREKSYRPDPIRRVFIPKANGKLRPLGISTVRDRVCMTAAMLVLEPIFEADLPPEQYAYRPGRNAQQAVVEVEALLFRGHPEVVDADLADYFGSIRGFRRRLLVLQGLLRRLCPFANRFLQSLPVRSLDEVDARHGPVDPDQFASAICQARRRQQHEELPGLQHVESSFDLDLGAGVRNVEQDAAPPPRSIRAHQIHGMLVIHPDAVCFATVKSHRLPSDFMRLLLWVVAALALSAISPQRTVHWLVERYNSSNSF